MANWFSNLYLPLELRPLAVDLDAEQPVVVEAAVGGLTAGGGVAVGAEAEPRTIALGVKVTHPAFSASHLARWGITADWSCFGAILRNPSQQPNWSARFDRAGRVEQEE